MLIRCLCHKYYFYFLVYWLLEISISITKNFIYVTKDIDIGLENDLMNEYMQLLILVISDLLAGFLVLYTKFSLPKKAKVERSKSKRQISYIYDKDGPVNKNKKIKLLILISFLDFSSRSIYFIFYLIKEKRLLNRYQTDLIVGMDIFMRYFFSRIILKTKFYKHHIWSMIISLIGFLILTILDIISIVVIDDKDTDKENDIMSKFLFLFILLLRALFYPLEDTINKILLSDNFLLPHSLMYDRGIIEFFILILFSLILYLTGELKFEYNYSIAHIWYILIKIGYTIVCFVQNFCIVKIIYIFNSQYVSFLIISESLAGTVNLLVNYFDEYAPDSIYIYKESHFTLIIVELLSLSIIIFGTLMYNEMIIINKWGLQEYTKKGLLLKEKNDFTNDEDEDNQDNENKDESINSKKIIIKEIENIDLNEENNENPLGIELKSQ